MNLTRTRTIRLALVGMLTVTGAVTGCTSSNSPQAAPVRKPHVETTGGFPTIPATTSTSVRNYSRRDVAFGAAANLSNGIRAEVTDTANGGRVLRVQNFTKGNWPTSLIHVTTPVEFDGTVSELTDDGGSFLARGESRTVTLPKSVSKVTVTVQGDTLTFTDDPDGSK